MRQDFINWLVELNYPEGTQRTQISRIKKVEEAYGDLEEHLEKGTYQEVIDSLKYSVADERSNLPNPSKIQFSGDVNVRNNLSSYKSAVVRYERFLTGNNFRDIQSENSANTNDDQSNSEHEKQKFSLERDMQAALRGNIKNLSPELKIIDDGAERSVDSGLIDITCKDTNSIVVVELKAGKADSRAIGQILGYMGDLQEEEEKPVRGILVAHEFDKRTKAAARAVPTLELKKYYIDFKFSTEV